LSPRGSDVNKASSETLGTRKREPTDIKTENYWTEGDEKRSLKEKSQSGGLQEKVV